MSDPKWSWSEFDEWSNKQEINKEIVKTLEAVSLLVHSCTQNLTEKQLRQVEKRLNQTLTQCRFFEAKKNKERVLYDLRDLGQWLVEFISDAERKFWNNN